MTTSNDHWQHQAFADTVFLASTHGLPPNPGSPLGLFHLAEMRIRAQSFTDAKLGRWLGWAQCAVVAADIGLTLEDMQAINTRAAEEFSTHTSDEQSPSGSKPEQVSAEELSEHLVVTAIRANTGHPDELIRSFVNSLLSEYSIVKKLGDVPPARRVHPI